MKNGSGKKSANEVVENALREQLARMRTMKGPPVYLYECDPGLRGFTGELLKVEGGTAFIMGADGQLVCGAASQVRLVPGADWAGPDGDPAPAAEADVG